MRKLGHFKVKKFELGNLMASLALAFSVMAANSRCAYIFHQPKLPENVRKLRKF